MPKDKDLCQPQKAEEMRMATCDDVSQLNVFSGDKALLHYFEMLYLINKKGETKHE